MSSIVTAFEEIHMKGQSDPEAIATFIKSNASHVARTGLETGTTSTWLWTELNKLGLPVIGIDARHANASQSCSGQRDRSWNEACEKAIRTGS
jgi:hypothetical protein